MNKIKEKIQETIQEIKNEKPSIIFWCCLYIVLYLAILAITWKFFIVFQVIHFILIFASSADGDKIKGVFIITNIPFLIVGLIVLILLLGLSTIFYSMLEEFNNWIDGFKKTKNEKNE